MPDRTFPENPFIVWVLRGIPVNKLKSKNVPTPPDMISARRMTEVIKITNSLVTTIIRLSEKCTNKNLNFNFVHRTTVSCLNVGSSLGCMHLLQFI